MLCATLTGLHLRLRRERQYVYQASGSDSPDLASSLPPISSVVGASSLSPSFLTFKMGVKRWVLTVRNIGKAHGTNKGADTEAVMTNLAYSPIQGLTNAQHCAWLMWVEYWGPTHKEGSQVWGCLLKVSYPLDTSVWYVFSHQHSIHTGVALLVVCLEGQFMGGKPRRYFIAMFCFSLQTCVTSNFSHSIPQTGKLPPLGELK